MKKETLILLIFLGFFLGCKPGKEQKQNRAYHEDVAYIQDYAVKYKYDGDGVLLNVAVDRNDNIQILSNKGLLRLTNGELLWPGNAVEDDSYRFMSDKNIVSIGEVDKQFVYLDSKHVFSNAWAGSLFIAHNVVNPKGFVAYKKDAFIVYSNSVVNFVQGGRDVWSKELNGEEILSIIQSDTKSSTFFALTSAHIYQGDVRSGEVKEVYAGDGIVAITEHQEKLVLAHHQKGLIYLDDNYQQSRIIDKLPSLDLTYVKSIRNNLWVGSKAGAFKINGENQIDYYASKRWLVDDNVLKISAMENDDILLLTEKGLSQIVFKEMTLAEKASFYEKQVRQRHIRNGFNATVRGMLDGNLGMGYMADSDNDGLWTSMYLGAQVFRYAVTKEEEALQNCRESLDAMERLFTINPVKGFAARSYERTGHKELLGDSEHWVKSHEEDWDWKSTTSSDEAIGHIFVYGVVAELIDDEKIKKQAIRLIDSMMTHIIENDMYLVDYDGKPTLWGRWNPEYVNGFAENIGDRKLNSSNIIAMLQTAYHFTKKDIFKDKAYELMDKHGYLENLMRPMSIIAKAGDGHDDLSQLLSTHWNHSDDEMYFLGYWGLYRYAFTDELKLKYKETILDHWEAERPEKDGLWNIMTALTGVSEFGLDDAIWYLQRYPLDLVDWTITNSNRKDIEFIEDNFRKQFTKEVLPPSELRISRHNANRFGLDGSGDGRSECSAGDIWLLPYWMARYLEVIK